MEAFNPDCPIRQFDAALKPYLRNALPMVHMPSESRTRILSYLDASGQRMAAVSFYWPVDGLQAAEDYAPMLKAVFDTLERNVASGNLVSLTCYMRRRTAEGWLEWGVALATLSGPNWFIAHIQREPGAAVERHS